MAQFGIHALLGLWIAWRLPVFSPYVLRSSFGFGIFIGCALPDIDVYAEMIAFFINPEIAPHFHRTLTHSVITAALLLAFFSLLERVVHKKQHQLYDIEATSLDDESLLRLGGVRASFDRTPRLDLQAFGIGAFAGMLTHILLDVVVWFAPVDLLFPLSHFGFSQPVQAWKYVPSLAVKTVLTLSEPLCFAVFLTVLRVSVGKKLGKWAEVYPDEIKKRKQSFNDSDIEHASMDFSLHAQEDICPLDQKTLSQARPALKISKGLIVFQYLFFLGVFILTVAKVVTTGHIEKIIFGELMVVCIPAYCYLGWALRDVILRKTDL